jgi:SAM-dependent methyltransferase
VPYRVDLIDPPGDALDRLVALGALDVEATADGVAALMPDGVSVGDLTRALGVEDVRIGPAIGRDDDSVWVLAPRATAIAGLAIVPAGGRIRPATLQLVDSAVFGTGLHPTTALCLGAIRDLVETARPASVLDVGTGSGVLALGALMMGVPRATAIDLDAAAITTAGENARINGLRARCDLVHGSLDCLRGTWPLVVANSLAAPLIEMAPDLVRLVAHRGQLLLSGIADAVRPDVDRAYTRAGTRCVRTESRAGWTTIVMEAGW